MTKMQELNERCVTVLMVSLNSLVFLSVPAFLYSSSSSCVSSLHPYSLLMLLADHDARFNFLLKTFEEMKVNFKCKH